jgi:hypothetical protein
MNCNNFITFVKEFNLFDYLKDNHPEQTTSYYGDGANEYKDEKAVNFRINIRRGIEQAKIFEIEDDVKKLLCLTDTPIQNDEIELPFSSVFLDVHFTKEELFELGIPIKMDEVIGIMVQKGVLLSKKGNEVVGTDLRVTILSRIGEEAIFDTFNKNLNITNEKYKQGSTILHCFMSDDVTREFTHRFFLNFLNFLNNPEIELVEHKRSVKNQERKAKQGKIAIPSTYAIRINGKLKVYIDELTNGAEWTYNYRFWVRGHFRQLQSDRYAVKKRIWILPYIKGKGILVDKSYEVRRKNETCNL